MSEPNMDPMAVENSKTPEGFEDWTEERALELATEEHIELTDAHWEMIHFLRRHCEENGATCSARLVLKAMTSQVKERGGKVTREAGPMKHGTTVIAFVEDPDGYKIEVLQRHGHYQ